MVDLTGNTLPSALWDAARFEHWGPSGIPVLLAHPDRNAEAPVPVVIWMHGRTVSKELDPGRYLRWLRAGIGVCAVDLPGHGERLDPELQLPERALDVVLQMTGEIDELIDELRTRPEFDSNRMAIGGMSAGGMATLTRLCRDHPFRCASVEATTGSWMSQRRRKMFRGLPIDQIEAHNPLDHLEDWREIPLQAIHSRLDEWVGVQGQETFINTLKDRYDAPELVEFIVYAQTGAPYEHAGFGTFAADAKDRQTAFFQRHLHAAPVSRDADGS